MGLLLTVNSWEYRCWHEAGHIIAAYLADARVEKVVCKRSPAANERSFANIHHDGDADTRRYIGVAGHAVERLLFEKGALIDEAGNPLAEKAFINITHDNAQDDKISFFQGDNRVVNGQWPKNDDIYFMDFAKKRLCPALESRWERLELLANKLCEKEELDQAEI